MKSQSCRVFLDANVIFTAAYNPTGLARLLFDLDRLSVLTLLGSEHVLEEARINLSLKRPGALDELRALEERIRLIPVPAQPAVSLELPQDDLLVFAAALAGRSTHLLTGDKKHFAPYFDRPDETRGVWIQTVRRFFDERF